MENILHSHANETHFHKKGCALGLFTNRNDAWLKSSFIVCLTIVTLLLTASFRPRTIDLYQVSICSAGLCAVANFAIKNKVTIRGAPNDALIILIPRFNIPSWSNYMGCKTVFEGITI